MPAPQDFAQMYRELKARVDALERRSPLANSGLSVTDEGVVTVGGNLVVAGDFTAQGKISNEALVSPVRTDSVLAYGSNFAVTATGSTPLASTSRTTPTGFTQVNVMMAVRVLAVNTSGVTDYLNVRPRVALSSGAQFVGQAVQVEVANGKPGLNVAFISVEAVNLAPGETITLQTQAWTNGAGGWSANGANWAELSAQLLWTR